MTSGERGRRELQQLFDAGRDFVPGMNGEVGGHAAGFVTFGQDNRGAIENLFRTIRASRPEGGEVYARYRAWNMLVWQPVVLAAIGVARLGRVVDLLKLSQRVTGPAVLGYRLPGGVLRPACTYGLVNGAGGAIRALADRLYGEMNEVAGLRALLAERLLADRLAGVSLALGGSEEPEAQRARIDHWLRAAGLEGQSGVIPVALDGGATRLALRRKACCLEYLVEPGQLCESCPRQSEETLRARIRAGMEADVRAD
ncbi:siderophore ferric iron reductase [Minwuia thermotolerans]|uniref:siderophore ferric iron reductase n=1 Tax=Minwuia thermotolerans TaxID=2056226 RepID=UPI000D6DC420|nr:siderophore ferric iron reductase [Minwuia thermotolerans]